MRYVIWYAVIDIDLDSETETLIKVYTLSCVRQLIKL